MRKYGKGTGKWAFKNLSAAQDALKEAMNAVPVWIMPLHRAAQMFSNPKAGMFDVVIFDEASQCDIRGLMIAHLGKKLLLLVILIKLVLRVYLEIRKGYMNLFLDFCTIFLIKIISPLLRAYLISQHFEYRI